MESHANKDANLHAHGDEPHGISGHGSKRAYLIGFALSAVLTAVPFWLVMSGVLADRGTTAVAIVALAMAQIAVHTIRFLHVNTRSEGGWTLLALTFTGVIVTIVISGSLWIMYHLNSNMMPMSGDMPGM